MYPYKYTLSVAEEDIFKILGFTYVLLEERNL